MRSGLHMTLAVGGTFNPKSTKMNFCLFVCDVV